MPPISTSDIRTAYLDFFQSKGHAVIPGASLIPENDPTVLFTTAGMHPLVPYLMGETHPAGKRLVDVQLCIRTQDIDEVGDSSHLTCFEMLGNWSLGDYFKEGAIHMSFEFLTKVLGLPVKMLAVTCFEGDNDAPRDDESAGYWMKMGIPKERIGFLPKAKNWWGPAGKTGPCGPDTEMFYWVGEGGPQGNPATHDAQWLEIWNDVFMQYNKDDAGKFTPLKKQCVDTGMGLERVAKVMQGVESVYETDAFQPVMEKVFERAGGMKNYELRIKNMRAARIIVDHLKAATFIIADGVTPSNVDQGYVLRRLIRRAIRSARTLAIKQEQEFCSIVATSVIDQYKNPYAKLEQKKAVIVETLNKEEQQFGKTLLEGMKHFEKIIEKIPGGHPSRHPAGVTLRSTEPKRGASRSAGGGAPQDDNVRCKNSEGKIDGLTAFHLYDTYGFPLELTKEMAQEKGLKVDDDGFKKAFEEHQSKSRAGAEKRFAGGLADHSDETTKLHTATHLLNQALRTVLGDHVYQKGSNITTQRLRFDFSHAEKMTPEQIKKVEDLVNEAIKADAAVSYKLMSVDEAKASGAIGVFDDKYAEIAQAEGPERSAEAESRRVKVYTMADRKTGKIFSKEICGGPHVARTGLLGSFKIQKEESSSAGVRRIKAVVSGGPEPIEVAKES